MNKNNSIYLMGLNGIRAIAALAVVISHTTQSLSLFGLNPNIFGTFSDGNPKGVDLGGFGVSIFFSLSGFLITYLLLKEKEKNKVIRINKFYIRRLLRIWPLYYLYFIIILFIYFLFEYSHQNDSILYYIFFGANIPFILGTTMPFLAHYWSIGVEEQFYLFWPWFFKLKTQNLLFITFFIIFILIGTKVYLHLFTPNSILETIIHITRFHCMLIGAIGAILFYVKNFIFLKVTTHYFSQIISWGVILLAAINQFHLISFLDNEFISIITVFLIMGQITSSSFISLENKVFDFLGKISYGIYIIHPVLIFIYSKIFFNLKSTSFFNYYLMYGIILSTTTFLAYLSYHFFEKYFLNLKARKYSIIISTNNITNKQ